MFGDVIAEVNGRQKQVTVYAAGETDVVDRFETRNVTVSRRQLGPDAPGPFLAIHEGSDFRGAVGLDTFSRLLEPPAVRPGRREDLSLGYRALFEILDETVFASLDRRQLLAASREIEDRALRVADGTLRVGFQRLSAFESQASVYRNLAAETTLDIHVYGERDWTPPDLPGVTYHAGTEDSNRYWFLAFDGGSDRSQACGLLARAHDGHYTGFWTYDPSLTSAMLGDIEAVSG